MKNKDKIEIGKTLFHSNFGLVTVHYTEKGNFDVNTVCVTLGDEQFPDSGWKKGKVLDVPLEYLEEVVN